MELYGLCNDALLDFWNVAELYGLRNNALLKGPEGNKQGSKADRKCPQMKLGYNTFYR